MGKRSISFLFHQVIHQHWLYKYTKRTQNTTKDRAEDNILKHMYEILYKSNETHTIALLHLTASVDRFGTFGFQVSGYAQTFSMKVASNIFDDLPEGYCISKTIAFVLPIHYTNSDV